MIDDAKLEDMYNKVSVMYEHLCRGPQAKRSDLENHQIAMGVVARALKRAEKKKKVA